MVGNKVRDLHRELRVFNLQQGHQIEGNNKTSVESVELGKALDL